MGLCYLMNLLDFQDDAEFITFRCPYLKFNTGSLLLIATIAIVYPILLP